MLLALLFKLFSLVPFAATAAVGADPQVIQNPRVAQVRLVELLAGADGIHQVEARAHEIVFAVTRDDQELTVIATTNARHEVIAIELFPIGATPGGRGVGAGGLTWLADELETVTAITRLEADEEGAVTLTTDDRRRYMLIPGRGSGGPNAAAAARWAATWSE
jgi:hypothetical protein